MTTLILKSNLALKALAHAESILGAHHIKTGRYWYKSQQICDFIVLKKPGEIQIQTSGGVRFNMILQNLAEDDAKGRVTLLGWLKESPNALRILMSILEHQAKIVQRRRQERLKLLQKYQFEGQLAPELREQVGMHFSIKMADALLEETQFIDENESDKNFEAALKTHWYHQNFVSFCKKLGVKCYYRSAMAAEEAASLNLSHSEEAS